MGDVREKEGLEGEQMEGESEVECEWGEAEKSGENVERRERV